MAKARGNHPSTHPLAAPNRGLAGNSRVRKTTKLAKVEHFPEGLREGGRTRKSRGAGRAIISFGSDCNYNLLCRQSSLCSNLRRRIRTRLTYAWSFPWLGWITRPRPDDLPLEFRTKDKRQQKGRRIICKSQGIARQTK